MERDEQGYTHAITQFVAERTGLALERAARIVTLGEPWPHITAQYELFLQSSCDAEASGVPWEIALNANRALAEMGMASLAPESIDRHIEQTAALTGESLETIETVHTALLLHLRSQLDELKQMFQRAADHSKESS